MNNAGTFTKSGSAATSTISTTFNNTGTVDVLAGTLVFANTLTNTGTVQADGGNIRLAMRRQMVVMPGSSPAHNLNMLRNPMK